MKTLYRKSPREINGATFCLSAELMDLHICECCMSCSTGRVERWRYENTVGRRRVVVETLARNKKPGGQKAEE